jgi:HK97 family phage major capsid protein
MAHKIYENFVLENKIEDMLVTKLGLAQFCTVDNSLTANPGMIKKIHKYTATGDVEDLAMGEGNTQDIEVTFTEEEYEVGTTQGRFQYYDEQEMTDPMVIDTGLAGISAKMTNDLNAKVIAEFDKATLTYDASATGLTFDAVVDAISKYPYESEDGLFLIINPSDKAALRKNLGQELKYVEDFARTGYIGTVCGVPVYVSKAVPAKKAFLADKNAVTLFYKKGSEIEQDRDPNVRLNKVFARKVMLVALTDATRVIEIATAV